MPTSQMMRQKKVTSRTVKTTCVSYHFLMDWNDVFKEPKDLKRKKLKPSGKGETFIPVISIVCLDKELGIH